MKNAMSSLVAGAFGLGNLVGTMSGGIFNALMPPTACMVMLTESGGPPNYNATNGLPLNHQLESTTEIYEQYWLPMDKSVASTTEYDSLFTKWDDTLQKENLLHN